MASVQKIDLVDIELNTGIMRRSFLSHSIGTGDNNANGFGVRVFRDGQPVDLSGVSVQGYFRDPQGNNIAITSGNTVSGNVAYAVLPQACYNFNGQFTLSIKLIGGGVTGTMRIIDGMVDNTNTGNAVAPTEAVPTYQEVLAVYENMQDTLDEYDTVVSQQNAEIDAVKSAITPLDLLKETYVYTASSGYQNIAITLSARTYKATCTNSGAIITFRDSSNATVSNISIPQNANNYEFTVTPEQASSIAYIRMYQGSVIIWPNENIVTRVETLESEMENKADTSALNTKEDKPKQFSPEEITIESGYISTTEGTYTAGEHFKILVSNTAIRYKISGQHVNSVFPLLCQHKTDGTVVSSYSGDAGAVTNYIFTPNSETAYFYVNAYGGNGKCEAEEYVDTETLIDEKIAQAEAYTDSKVYFDAYNLRQNREAKNNLDQKNPFAWKPFDKAYFSWMNDDGLSDMYLYKNLCDNYDIPYANAVPWTGIKNNTSTIDGMTIVNYCKKIIAEGGEIFVHAGSPLTSESTEEEIMELFRDGKKIMEDAIETKIYGIIQAGGAGYSTFDKNEGQKFCLAYYEFSDDYGITPQYKLNRTRILRSSYESDEAQINAYKAVIDDAITNHKWVRFYCHSTSETSIEVLTSVFDYIAEKVGDDVCAWTTWKDMYDTFRSSELENRILALEN